MSMLSGGLLFLKAAWISVKKPARQDAAREGRHAGGRCGVGGADCSAERIEVCQSVIVPMRSKIRAFGGGSFRRDISVLGFVLRYRLQNRGKP